jgi:hypothetical protein
MDSPERRIRESALRQPAGWSSISRSHQASCGGEGDPVQASSRSCRTRSRRPVCRRGGALKLMTCCSRLTEGHQHPRAAGSAGAVAAGAWSGGSGLAPEAAGLLRRRPISVRAGRRPDVDDMRFMADRRSSTSACGRFGRRCRGRAWSGGSQSAGVARGIAAGSSGWTVGTCAKLMSCGSQLTTRHQHRARSIRPWQPTRPGVRRSYGAASLPGLSVRAMGACARC